MDSRFQWITTYNTENNDEYKNYVISGQYLAIYLPNHHKSRKDGYVYIHQLQAEKMLGRPLKDSECVHHIDENKFNNSLDNLMVFKTVADHTAFHQGATIYQDKDIWVANIKTFNSGNHRKCICPVCNINYKDSGAKMCIDCYSKERTRNIPDKEILQKLILQLPFTTIGKKFNVSDNAVRKWCKKYKLPYAKKDVLIFRDKYKLNEYKVKDVN